MQILGRLGTTLGLLTVGAALLLSMPGIRVARADGDDSARFQRFEQFVSSGGEALPSPSSPSGPSCATGPARAVAREAQAEQLMARVRAQMAARAAAGVPSTDSDGVVLLNGRGYNY